MPSINRRTAASSVTSACWPSSLEPLAAAACASASNSSWIAYAVRTVAPSSRSARLTARPSPPAPPATSAIFPENRALMAQRVSDVSTERRHHLSSVALHRAQHSRLLHITEPEAAVEVGDAYHLSNALDLAYARLGRTDDEEAIEKIVYVGLGLRGYGNGVTILHALVVVAQAQRHSHVPAGMFRGVARIRFALGHIDRALHADERPARRLDLGYDALENLAELGQSFDR